MGGKPLSSNLPKLGGKKDPWKGEGNGPQGGGVTILILFQLRRYVQYSKATPSGAVLENRQGGKKRNPNPTGPHVGRGTSWT